MHNLATKNSILHHWSPLLGYKLPLSTLCDHNPQPHMAHSNTDSEDTNSNQSLIQVHSLILPGTPTQLGPPLSSSLTDISSLTDDEQHECSIRYLPTPTGSPYPRIIAMRNHVPHAEPFYRRRNL